MNLKIITVIIPVYNIEKYVERCIRSIIDQDYINKEIIVVDDGSTDQSGWICDELAREYVSIKVFHTMNQGLGPARNYGLDRASGEYIFFVDGDDFIFPGTLGVLERAIEEHDADIACCGCKSGGREFYTHKDSRAYTGIEATKKMFCSDDLDSNAPCKLYKRELLDGLSYPAVPGQVIPVTYKILLRCNRIVSTGWLGYYIEKREGSITRSAFNEKTLGYISMSRDVCQEIKGSYPDLYNAAYSFYQKNKFET